jgi:hypothetical protein
VHHSSGEYVRADVHTNSAEGYFSIFKRGMRGISQRCGQKHLHRYLAEYIIAIIVAWRLATATLTGQSLRSQAWPANASHTGNLTKPELGLRRSGFCAGSGSTVENAAMLDRA